MGILDRIFSAESRISDLANPRFWSSGQIAAAATKSGKDVTPDSAMKLTVYFACLRAISEDVGKLPLKVYQKLSPRGKEYQPDHPAHTLLHDAPNSETSSIAFRETLTHYAMSWGNGYAEIVLSPSGQPMAMWHIHPSRVRINRTESKQLIYEVRNDDYTTSQLLPEQVFHLHGLGSDTLSGYSIAQFAAESIGYGESLRDFGSSYFRHGAKVGGVLEHPSQLSKTAAKNFRESWDSMYTGSENANKTYIAEEGMTYKPLGIPPEDGQFIESMQFNVEDIARWFRMPPHKVGHLLRAAGWSTLEATNTDYVTDTLMPWLVRWEQEIKRKLFGTNETDLFAEHVVAGMMRGDSVARSAYYREQFNIGAISINEIRELENRNPIGPEGDVYYVSSNMETADQAADPDNQQDQQQGGDNFDQQLEQSFTGIFVDVAERVLHNEARAAQRAGKKYADDAIQFDAWMAKYYRNHHQSVVDAFRRPLQGYVELCKLNPAPAQIESILQDYAVGHIESSQRTLRFSFHAGDVQGCCEQWLRQRPRQITEHMLTAIKGIKNE